MRRGGRLLTAAAVAAVLGAAGPALAAPADASPTAASPQTQAGPPLAVTVATVSPAALAPGRTLTVRGTVRNTTSTAIPGVTVTLREHAPLTTRAEVAAWQGAAPQGDRGFLLRIQQISKPLAAGASRAFSFALPATQLGLDAAAANPQAVGLAVSAEGATAGSDRLTVVRTFAVWQPRPVADPVRLSVLVPVTQPVATTGAPGSGADAGSAAAHPASDWSGQSRLARVLAATTDSRISWAVDPALLSSASAPATGAKAGATPSPATTPGTAAGSWFAAFVAGARARDVSVLPWGDPDVVALARGGATELLSEAESTATATLNRLLQRHPAATVTLPVDGRADASTLRTLALSGRTVVLDRGSLRADAPPVGGRVDLAVTARRQPTTVTQAVLSDRVLSADLAATGSGAVPSQHLLADLAVTAAEYPGQPLLVTTPRSWNPDPATARTTLAAVAAADWVDLRSFSELTRTAAGGTPRPVGVAYSAVARGRELPADHVAGVAAADRGLSGFAPALPDQTPVTELRAVALSLVSLGWRGRSSTQLALARTPLTTAVDGLYAGLSVDPGSTKNLLAKEGLLPISARNALPYKVTVLLVLSPLSGQLSVKGAVRITLEPHSSRQFFVPVRAVANGDVAVVASFRTAPDGRAILYQSPRIEVRVRSDWETRGLGIVAIVLALLLFAGLARGVRRGRGRTRIPPESVPDPDDIGRVPVPETQEEAAAQVEPVGVEEPDRERAPAVAEPDGRDEVLPAAVPTASAQAVAAAGAATGRGSVTATIPRVELTVEAPSEPVPSRAPAPSVRSEPTAQVAGTTSDGPAAAADDAALLPSGDGRADEPTTEPEEATPPPDGDGDGSTAGLMGSSAVMAAGTLLSRVLGMVRVVVLAWAIGAAFSANAFSTANTLPNSLFLLIGGGVLNAVLVPQIVAAMQRPDGGRDYVDRLLTLSLGVLAVATIVVTAAAPLLLRLFASPTWSPEQIGVGVAFAFWCLPQVFFYGLYTVLGQVLNARGSFGPYMWAPVVNNLVAIAGMVVFVALYGSGARPATWWTPAAIAVLAGTTTLGVIAQALILVPVLRRTGFRWRPRRGFRGVGLRSAGSVAGWTFGALLVGQLGLVLVSRIANEAGQQAGDAGTGRFVYDTAYLLFMLPHSLVAVSVVTAVFTRMSHAVVTGRLDAVRADVSIALRTVGVATVLATVAFAVLGPDLTTLLFATNTRATAQGLAWTTTAMVLGLVPFSALYLFQRVYYAFGDARTPFWVQVLVIVVWSIGNVLAAARLTGVGVVVGIGVAMSVANLAGAVALGVLTRRRIGGVDGRRVMSTYLRCTVAAVVAGVLAWAAAAATHLFAGEGHRGALLALAIGGSVLLVVYLAVLRLLRVRELADLAGPLRRVVRV